MSVGPSSPLPGARGPGPGGRAAPPPRRLTGRPWPLPLPSRPVAASSSSPHPARAQSARRPRAPPPAPHSSPPLPGGGCGASPERARVPRPEDGWMERARTRACARAPLSPLPRRGREARRERAPTSSSSSSRPSSTPRPRPPFLFLLSLSRAQRLLAPARRARARASAPRPQLGSICSRGRGPGGEEGRHAAVQSTGGRELGRGDGRGLRGQVRPIAECPGPRKSNRLEVGGAAFKVRCAVRQGRRLGAVPAGSGAEATGWRRKRAPAPSRAWDAFRPRHPRPSRGAPSSAPRPLPTLTPRHTVSCVRSLGLKWGAVRRSGRYTLKRGWSAFVLCVSEWVTSHPRPPNREELKGKDPLPSASCVLLSGARSRPYPNLDPTPARLSCFRSPRWTLHLSDSRLGTGQILPTLNAAPLGGPLSAYSCLLSFGRKGLFLSHRRCLDLRSHLRGCVCCLEAVA